MAVIRVKKTSENGRYNGKWAVVISGGVASTHRTKRQAADKARARATVGDTIIIQKANGVIQSRTEKEEISPLTGPFSDIGGVDDLL